MRNVGMIAHREMRVSPRKAVGRVIRLTVPNQFAQ